MILQKGRESDREIDNDMIIKREKNVQKEKEY